MPSYEAAVVAWVNWPEVPEGWTRHMLPGGNEYPPKLETD